MANKRTQILGSNSLNGSMEFSSVASRNTMNVKYKKKSPVRDSAGQSLEIKKGIISGGGGMGNAEFLDDSDI